ncbi:hypothetical protein DYB26_013224 [Aphanomyces astaci]|uniref:Uncharacterized protein n=3 Tax=Aphanomyces astaci TaxID=112090 RepID=A0A3R7BMC5_APHAT|nr:hypothetical protein DYB26_013224 [Aphanomyces astaci]
MKPRQTRQKSSMENSNSATPQATEYATMQESSRPPVVASSAPRNAPPGRGKSARLGCLQFIDSRQWHYFFMLLLFLDFFGNCIAVSFTSSENFYKYGPKTRVASIGFGGVYVVDMFLRLIEMYIDAVYCFFVAIRIVLKPRARTFSKKLHKYANHDHLRISMASLRTSIRRIPGITAVRCPLYFIKFDNCIELMQFLQKALLYRPKDLSANAFLAHLRDIDAMASYAVYGAYDVVKSTFRHW